jgi:hypothetical protein
MVQGDEGVCPRDESMCGKDERGGRDKSVVKGYICCGTGGGRTHVTVELEATSPMDVV